MQETLAPEDNAELLEALAGLARDRPGMDKRAANSAELAVLRLAFRSRLLIVIGTRRQPRLLPSLLPRVRGPGRVAVVFTDEEAAQGWIESRKPEGPFCNGFASASGVIGAEEPDPKRWRRWLERNRINLLSVNPAGPHVFVATALDFDSAGARLIGRGATAPHDSQGAWLDTAARADMRVRMRRALDQLASGGPEEPTAELRGEIDTLRAFGSRLFQSQLLLLPGRGNANSTLHGVFGAASAGDPCLAIDGLLELGEAILSALAKNELEEKQRKELHKRLKTTALMLGHLTDVGYRTAEIKQLSAARRG